MELGGRRQGCDYCSQVVDDLDFHNSTPQHQYNYLLYIWKLKRKTLAKNRHGAVVTIIPSKPKHNGIVFNYQEDDKRGKHCLKITPTELVAQNKMLQFSCTVKNARKSDGIIITNIQLLSPYESIFSLHDEQNNIGKEKYLELEAGAKYSSVKVVFTAPSSVMSFYEVCIAFSFQNCGTNPHTFYIVRTIIIEIEENISEPEETTKSLFTDKDWGNIEICWPTQNMRYRNEYSIPPEYYNYLKFGLKEYSRMNSQAYYELHRIREKVDPGYVTLRNYKQYWDIVLWIEETYHVMMLKRYNMENVTWKLIHGNFFELVIPYLGEKRPSVIVGDMIDIRVHEEHIAYRGVVKCVNDLTVEIAYINEELLSRIRSSPETALDVRFVLSRLSLERMHQGVDRTIQNGLISSLFPDYNLKFNTIAPQITIEDYEYFNNSVVKNVEQRMAVENILNASSMSAPYIVFGPPGTGKTVTIVEAILQIKMKTKKNILVCAPANAACDMLVEKLIPHCTNRELIRIMSENVDKQSIKPHITDYSNCRSDGVFIKLLPEMLAQFRIVVTTLILVGRYSTKYHPDVVFIDEAAQACEPEVASALSMMQKGKQIILAGDPNQLGPIVCSKVAKAYGLGQSLLERLMDLELYKSMDSNFITMLKSNFRSHSQLLKLPNILFYNGQLRPMSVRSENDPIATICIFNLIKNHRKRPTYPGQAFEFCSVLSKERRQGKSPSYFNDLEMGMVLKYVQALTALVFPDEEHKVLPEHIGIITPYVRQVYKIRTKLREHHFEGVEVGTTETFQGREKRIIIISTVRAQYNLLLYDKMYNLGFVSNAKRFNVAITRAKSKLIVIGCAHLLDTNDNWQMYMQMCEEAHVFCGAPLIRRTREVREDITRRLRSIGIHIDQHNV